MSQTVFVLEDDTDIARLVQHHLQAAGFEARLFHTPTNLIPDAERKALDSLGLEVNASADDVKTRFKALVKRHHPDANGGDRSLEDKLREIIRAYSYLKSVKLA